MTCAVFFGKNVEIWWAWACPDMLRANARRGGPSTAATKQERMKWPGGLL